MSGELARLLLAAVEPSGGTRPVLGGVCTAWDPATNRSTVQIGVATYVNLPILASALATMGTGLVVLLNTDSRPLILGRLALQT